MNALEKYQVLQARLETILILRGEAERDIKALDVAWNQHPYLEGNRPSRATLAREDERLVKIRLRDAWEERLREIAVEMDALAPAVDAEDRAREAS